MAIQINIQISLAKATHVLCTVMKFLDVTCTLNQSLMLSF